MAESLSRWGCGFTLYSWMILGLIFLALAVQSKAHCPPGFFHIGQSCYFVYNGTKDLFTWTQAREQCKILHPNAALLEIHDQETQDSLNVVISLVSWPVWIGLRADVESLIEASSFQWVTSKTSSSTTAFTHWSSDAFADIDVTSDRRCVFLSTSSLQLGVWELCDCEKTRLGFACQLPLDAPAPSQSEASSSQLLLQSQAAKPVWSESANEDGQACYLGTCYRLLVNASVEESYEDARAHCYHERLALPKSQLELTFLKRRLKYASNSTRAWLGVEVTNTKDHLEFEWSPSTTPWLTAAIHHSTPNFHRPPSNDSEVFCLQLGTEWPKSNSPFFAVPCQEDGEDYEEEEEEEGGDEEAEELDEDSDYFFNHNAPPVTAFCSTPQREVRGSCPGPKIGDTAVEWHQFGDQCFAVMGECIGDAVPAILKDPDVETFVSGWLPAKLAPGDEVLFGGIVNTTSPLTIIWVDGSIGQGFNRLKPKCLQRNITEDGFCLTIEPGSGWWVLRECKGPTAPRLTLCSAPIIPQNDSAPAPPTNNANGFDSKSPCPEDYMPLLQSNGEISCYRISLGGPRAHGHDWRTSERTCRRITGPDAQKRHWIGHLASLPDAESLDALITLLQQHEYAAGILESVNSLPAHIMKPSEFVWLGLSKTEDNLFWNNWTDGSTGSSAFYESKVGKQHAFFGEPTGYYFDQGSCIALHLPTGTWYPLRCTLDLGYLCQATAAIDTKAERPNDHFETPSCLYHLKNMTPPPSKETGFIQEPRVDCIADGFKYFNGQCFKAIHDRFLTFAEAQSHCRELGSQYSKNGNAGLAILRTEADQLFIASELSHLPIPPESPALYGRGSAIYDRIEVAWRRYHWVGLFHYRHGFHAVNERQACHIARELNRPLASSTNSPLCVSITGVPDPEHFGSLSFDIGCNERLPFVCSFEPSETRVVPQTEPVCPPGYATHLAITGDHCYKFIASWSGSYDDAAAMCAQTAPGAHLAALTTPYTVAWMHAHLPSKHSDSGLPPWEPNPHWIGLKVLARNASPWKWANGLQVTHTRWPSPPMHVLNSSMDTCFAFSKSASMTSYELDMITVDCSRHLSPLCEVAPRTNRQTFMRQREAYHTSTQSDYIGWVDKTSTGKSCIRWDLLAPSGSSEMELLQRAFHNATLAEVMRALNDSQSEIDIQADSQSIAFQPAFSASSNWCRNPGGVRSRAFCYTSNDTWEYCNLPAPTPESAIQKGARMPMSISMIGIALGAIVLLVLVIFLLVLIHRRSQRFWGTAGASTTFVPGFFGQQMLLQRIPMAWKWKWWPRSGSEPCLLAENVSYSAGLTPEATNPPSTVVPATAADTADRNWNV